MSSIYTPLPLSSTENQTEVLWKNTAQVYVEEKVFWESWYFPSPKCLTSYPSWHSCRASFLHAIAQWQTTALQARPEKGCCNKALVPLPLSFAFVFLCPWSPESPMQYVALMVKQHMSPAPLEVTLFCCGVFWLHVTRFLRHTEMGRGKSSGGGSEEEQNIFNGLSTLTKLG